MAEVKGTESTEEPIFSRSVEVERILQEEIEERIEASADELAVIAAFLELNALKSLRAEVKLAAWRRKGVKLSGRFEAVAEQDCVVTLDPIDCRYAEEFVRTFLPEDMLARFNGSEDLVEAEGEDPPDPIEDGSIDVGAVILEELALSINPYPRKEGAAIDSRYSGGDLDDSEAPTRPFAQLLALKKQTGEDNR